MKVEIGNIKIKVNKKTLTLTLKESETLFNELNKVFGPRYNYAPYWQNNGFGTLTGFTSSTLTVSGNGGSSTDVTLSNQQLPATSTDLNIDLTKQGE